MAQARCENGHIYDREIYGDACPYCGRETVTISFNKSAQQDFAFPAPDSRPAAAREKLGQTLPVGFGEKREAFDKTQPVFRPKEGKDPVVGWLVCVSGQDEGKDYRLAARRNTIGRGKDMDVQLRGDVTVTADTHAKIDYDAVGSEFYLSPGNSPNLIYCNKAPVLMPQLLKPYDRLRIGRTELIFVPFCCERFTWTAEDRKDDA